MIVLEETETYNYMLYKAYKIYNSINSVSFLSFSIISLLFYSMSLFTTIDIKKKTRFECKKCLARTMTRYPWIVIADHSDCRICYNLRYMDAKRYQKAFQDKQLVSM